MFNKIFSPCCYLFTLTLLYWSKDNILFWDTVQFVGKHGGWYYEQGIFSGLLPQEMDSGHPPLFGMYQAMVWKIFGKSLATSHFSMLPFLLLNLMYAIKLGKHFLGARYVWFVLAFLLCPFYLGHSVLVSPDLVLVTGFVICLYGVVSYKMGAVIVGSILLALISMRGFAVMGGLMIYQFWLLNKKEERMGLVLRKVSKCFGWGLGLFLLFQLWHYMESSWVGFHEDSPWSSSFGRVGLKQLVRNVLVFGWRLADYGMILAYLVIGYFLLKRESWREDLLPLLILLIGILGLLTLPFEGLLNHRYFLPVQLVALLLALKYLSAYRQIFSGLLVLGIALGNLIVYPPFLSQGWDATAAHWPYYKMEREMYVFIQNSKIDLTKVGTAFPLRTSRKHLDLGTSSTGYHNYNMERDRYILHSNIMNEFSDAETRALKYWLPMKTLAHRGVVMTLYERPRREK